MDFSTIQARVQIATKYASKYSLEAALVSALVEQESSWNTFAMRYEPLFFTKYIQPLLNRNEVHTMTEANARATSFGLAQVLGQTAREFGFQGKFLSELCDPDVGIEYGCKKLSNCFTKSSGSERNALLCYNGGQADEYPDLVLSRKQKYQ